ncbi:MULTISPECIES: galactonate dehydratase [unclassified Haladaptatus]|uniref:galactonate dehydratase n=1 Tax=unclassified Haladaptatus TaxID=2622732 RepID=UPI0023E7A8B2|nr:MULTISPECIES: galactonate dehydratase [unclassified Haladaptatus]
MRITDIETLPIGRWLFVRVHTDEGITGLGESGTWGFLEASEQAIETFKRYLIGKDPLRIEHHWQYLYRRAHFRGAAIMGALSAIDIALWDIAGKHFQTPAYQLLGGKCRDKARVYAHVRGDSTDKLVRRCEQAREQGFTAVGHLSPFLDESRREPYFETHAGKIATAANRVRRFREAVGDDVDLCIEIHRRLEPEEAVVLAHEIEQYRPAFYEDPIRPDNLDAMASVAEKINIPIATGERLHTIHEFEMLFRRDAVQYVRPDICMVGGLSHAKKIAALAEAHYAGVVPHNPLGPVSTAACLQLAACIPNFKLLEYPFRPDKGQARGSDLIRQELTCEDGYLDIPDGPGIGVELDDDALEKYPYEPREFVTRLHEDGSVVDQ